MNSVFPNSSVACSPSEEPRQIVQWKHRRGVRAACIIPYLDFIEEGPRLLQWNGDASETTPRMVGRFNQPFTQLFCHLAIALPLANLTVDDAPSLLSPTDHSLPLITEECQLQVELIPGEEAIRQ